MKIPPVEIRRLTDTSYEVDIFGIPLETVTRNGVKLNLEGGRAVLTLTFIADATISDLRNGANGEEVKE